MRFHILSSVGFGIFKLFSLLNTHFPLSVCFSVTKLTLDAVCSVHGHKRLYPCLNKEGCEKGPGVSPHPSTSPPAAPGGFREGTGTDEVCRIPFSGQVDHSASCSMNPEVYAVLQSREADPKNTEK